MNDKEIAEIRRRLKPDKTNINEIIGCYVNEKHEIISEFSQSLSITSEEEAGAFLSIFRRALSGTSGQNLIDIVFSTEQVMDSDEHRLLSALRSSELKDDGIIQQLIDKIVERTEMDGNYLILLAHEVYDVPFRAKDGLSNRDASSQTFSYILCALCPVKLAKPALSYHAEQNEFHKRDMDWVVAAPELGFMFPAFDGRCTNIHNALYYTKDTSKSHDDFIDAVFHTEPPLPADVQKETFQALIADSLDSECSYGVVQAVRDHICEKLDDHKASGEDEPLVISKRDISRVLSDCGVSEAAVEEFEAGYDSEYGEGAVLDANIVADRKKFELRTPDVVIHVAPDRSDLVQTRVINGKKYILIRADDGVEVNGVSIDIRSDE